MSSRKGGVFKRRASFNGAVETLSIGEIGYFLKQLRREKSEVTGRGVKRLNLWRMPSFSCIAANEETQLRSCSPGLLESRNTRNHQVLAGRATHTAIQQRYIAGVRKNWCGKCKRKSNGRASPSLAAVLMSSCSWEHRTKEEQSTFQINSSEYQNPVLSRTGKRELPHRGAALFCPARYLEIGEGGHLDNPNYPIISQRPRKNSK